jgi:hypothetical protein
MQRKFQHLVVHLKLKCLCYPNLIESPGFPPASKVGHYIHLPEKPLPQKESLGQGFIIAQNNYHHYVK